MGAKLLGIGNVSALLITIGAFLGVLPWPTAGLLIIAALAVTLLLHTNSKRVEENIPPALKALNPLPARSHEHQSLQPTTQTTEKGSVSKQPSASSMLHEPTRKHVTQQLPAPVPRSQVEPKDNLGQEHFTIQKGDYVSFDVDLDPGQQLVGEVSADGILNVYVLTEDNLASIDAGEEFWSEASQEGVEKATVQYTASERGTWFLVVENADDEAVSGIVKVRVELDSRHTGLDRLSPDAAFNPRRELSMGPRP